MIKTKFKLRYHFTDEEAYNLFDSNLFQVLVYMYNEEPEYTISKRRKDRNKFIQAERDLLYTSLDYEEIREKLLSVIAHKGMKEVVTYVPNSLLRIFLDVMISNPVCKFKDWEGGYSKGRLEVYPVKDIGLNFEYFPKLNSKRN